MKDDKLYELLVAKMHEVTVVPPQSIGILTPIYKRLVPRFKFYPFRSTLVISMLAALSLYLLFGTAVVSLASLLQFGF